MNTIAISSNTQTTQTVRVLVVEDEFILAINLQEILESLGYTVIDIADSAETAIEKAAQLLPNLILMDIRLRGEMDGIHAAEQIWNRLEIPVIYLTGHSDESTLKRASLTFPFGYILKPVREKELYVAIETALNRYEREQFLSSVLRGMGDGVIVVDSLLRIKYLNQVAEALTGWRFHEVKDQMLTNLIQLIDQQTQLTIENPIISALQQKTTVYLENRVLLIARDGTTIPIADSATPLRDNRGMITGAVMVFRNDSQRRLMEERNLATQRAELLEIQVAQLQRLNQLKQDFLASTSHEMRTPLSNIKMAIHMLENVLNRQGILNSEEVSTSDPIARYLNIMRDQCQREINLVDDLLFMQMIDADAYPLELTEIQLQDWLPRNAEVFLARIQAQQQTLQISVSVDLPPLVSDVASLTEIVSELLNNACKYTPADGQITVDAQLTYIHRNITNEDAESGVFINPQIPYLQITISNSGVQIPLKEQSLIFDPFYRIPESDRQKQGGTGLGLALVKRLVQCLQGTIQVSSTQGWTRFTILLPLSLSRSDD
ncbi:PAS/PAC sensor hybrid histidine kinase [Nostoc sp. NIES-4103]|nr:PAS/PAC sensor hybrid histidine kinase [Nostoc sp. NIES-4103]